MSRFFSICTRHTYQYVRIKNISKMGWLVRLLASVVQGRELVLHTLVEEAPERVSTTELSEEGFKRRATALHARHVVIIRLLPREPAIIRIPFDGHFENRLVGVHNESSNELRLFLRQIIHFKSWHLCFYITGVSIKHLRSSLFRLVPFVLGETTGLSISVSNG